LYGILSWSSSYVPRLFNDVQRMLRTSHTIMCSYCCEEQGWGGGAAEAVAVRVAYKQQKWCPFTAFTASLKSCIGHAVATRSWKCCTRGSRAAERQGRLTTAIQPDAASQFKPFGSANSGSQSNYRWTGHKPGWVYWTLRDLHWEFFRLWTGFELSSSWRRLPCYGASTNRSGFCVMG
jgi:hypothetical protein